METFHDVIGPDSGSITWWQMLARSLIVFICGIILVRVGARRMFGRSTPFDLMLAVIIGSLMSRAVTGGAPFLGTLGAVAALIFLHWLLALAAYHSDSIAFLAKGGKRHLVETGKIKREAMRAGKVGEEDLMEAIRLKGVAEAEEIENAYLERGGEISVIRRKS